LDKARHLEWRWPRPLNIEALHSQHGYNRVRYEETNLRTPPSPSFWPRTTPTDDFRAGGAALVVRNNTSPHVSMARFGLKWKSSKNRIASVSILNFHRINMGSGKSHILSKTRTQRKSAPKKKRLSLRGGLRCSPKGNVRTAR
jgi:hypothetical protein